jgi:hypothetical protein
MTFKRKFRGLQLMSAEQNVASAGRRGRPTRPVEERAWSPNMHAWVDRERRFAMEHPGDFWTLRIEHWVERRLSRTIPELESSDRDLWAW